jgi:oligopeptide/dipeptide ABC transporter ATP-binding protein
LLAARGLSKSFAARRRLLGGRRGCVRAVDDVSFEVAAGQTLGLVGESGCGKTTLGRLVLRLLEPDAGQILFRGTDLTPMSRRRLRPYRRHMQIVFQDPVGSLNPRMTVGDTVGEGLQVWTAMPRRERRQRVHDLLATVGLAGDAADRYPHEFSGGQRQRIGIARALAVEPDLIVCDEPVSALDVSVQAQILNLLMDLQDRLGVSYLFIAHDLGVVRHVSHRVAVMYLGQIVELAPTAQLFAAPAHPYTEVLLAAMPVPDPDAARRPPPAVGEMPSPLDPALAGQCRFYGRCPYRTAECRQPIPLVDGADGRRVRCIHPRPPR